MAATTMYERNSTPGIVPALLGVLFSLGVATAQTPTRAGDPMNRIRIATFNVALHGKRAGEIRDRLADRDDPQAKRIASIVQTVRPDVLLINELDYEPDAAPARRLAENYFAVAQDRASGDAKLQGIVYPFLFSAPSNTGIDSNLDLNRDGRTGSAGDAWGYGDYPGQYAMTVFSRFPIREDKIRSFQTLLWKSMPAASRPIDPVTGESYFDEMAWSKLRLSSKNHIDVPIQIGQRTLHVLASHPTPPVFDGPEDRNGARNHDEIEFWNHYLAGEQAGTHWLVDDAGHAGGLSRNAHFVVMGDLNADPIDGDGRRDAIGRLINHPRINDVQPKASNDDAAARLLAYRGAADVRSKTADFGRHGPMRVDYVLPSANLNVIESGVFWPAESDPMHAWVLTSDHRMVWIEVE